MDKDGIISKLRELGILSENCYPKKSFIDSGEPVVGLYKGEFASDFYFYTPFDKTLYVLRKTDYTKFKENEFGGATKYIVPLRDCETVWKDQPKEEIELPDEAFGSLTMRDYACIHLKVPKSRLPWLNELIKEGQQHDIKTQNMIV